MLLALSSASRASEIGQLNISYMSKQPSYYSFTLSKPTKVQKPGDPFTNIKYFKFEENEKLCVCSTLDTYLKRTESRRKGENQLLLGIVAPHKKVVTSTVSRWVKDVIQLSGIDVTIFKAHSTRTAASSKASSIGISVTEILKRAGWSNESTFQKFYNKSIANVRGKQFQAAVIKSFKER